MFNEITQAEFALKKSKIYNIHDIDHNPIYNRIFKVELCNIKNIVYEHDGRTIMGIILHNAIRAEGSTIACGVIAFNFRTKIFADCQHNKVLNFLIDGGTNAA